MIDSYHRERPKHGGVSYTQRQKGGHFASKNFWATTLL